ncbi:MAG: glycoside hydrolase family 3 C-terminal domain-containing protein [Acidimicrobiia bacterium]|nr:glycoside hydrolase family 3 C-terminal domain-containing protein [Acidimicrobiia bacterium]
MADLSALLAEMTLPEKVALLGGIDIWHTAGVERLGVPGLKVTDGPNGARGDAVLGSGTGGSACIPCGSALGATWDPDLVEELGVMLGEEADTKAAHVLLAPTINIHRHPQGGRNFECYSEDPELSGRLAIGFVRGVQSQGVATTPKHFVGNDSEFERNTIDSVIDERALREIYLRPFELALVEGGAWGVMSAYNRLNGTHCSENHRLLTEILRDEWQWDGFVISDWFATKATAETANAGMELEMPGPPAWYGDLLVSAVEAGDVAEDRIDELAGRMLLAIERTGAFVDPKQRDEQSIDRPDHRALCRRAATEATVLLTNDGVLPLDGGSLATLAVIGPNADIAQIMGGGSANVRPHYRRTPLDELRERLVDTDVVFSPGCVTAKTIPAIAASDLRTPDGEPGILVEYVNDTELAGPVVTTEVRDSTRLMTFGESVDGVDMDGFSYRARATYTPTETGPHTFSLIEVGRARLLVDGEVVVDGMTEPLPRGESFFGMGSVEATAGVELTAGQSVELVIEYSSTDAMLLYAANVGCRPPVPDDIIDRAVSVAADADAAVVVVGTNDDWETEGNDRASMDLPGEQAELIRRVAAANPRTVVVVNAGSPIDVSWADEVAAVVDCWFGGQGMAEGLVDVLLGDTDPGGRLPTTFPVRAEQAPSHYSYPGENGRVRYGEGVFVGYRGYDVSGTEPAFCFGHGQSYATFDWGEVDAPRAVDAGQPLTVRVPITNTSDRAGIEVVQLYVAPASTRLARPPQELKAFAKLRLGPGETATAELHLDGRAFAYYDPGLAEGYKPAALGHAESSWASEAGWRTDAGRYGLRLARSSRDIVAVAEIEVT